MEFINQPNRKEVIVRNNAGETSFMVDFSRYQELHQFLFWAECAACGTLVPATSLTCRNTVVLRYVVSHVDQDGVQGGFVLDHNDAWSSQPRTIDILKATVEWERHGGLMVHELDEDNWDEMKYSAEKVFVKAPPPPGQHQHMLDVPPNGEAMHQIPVGAAVPANAHGEPPINGPLTLANGNAGSRINGPVAPANANPGSPVHGPVAPANANGSPQANGFLPHSH